MEKHTKKSILLSIRRAANDAYSLGTLEDAFDHPDTPSAYLEILSHCRTLITRALSAIPSPTTGDRNVGTSRLIAKLAQTLHMAENVVLSDADLHCAHDDLTSALVQVDYLSEIMHKLINKR